MNLKRSNKVLLLLVSFGILALALLGLLIGDIPTDCLDVYHAIFSYSDDNLSELIVREIRLPRVCMALTAGAALSIAGMLMQTLFQNPLAGPYVLGINSGASLMVALGILSGAGFLSSEFGLIGSALIGAFIFGLFILFTASFLRNQIGLLLFGVMLGSFVSAIITILELSSEAESLKAFTLWSMGSLNGVTIEQLPIIFLVFVLGCIVALFIVFVTALFTGLITAFCGPIAFIGLAIPNLTRMLFKTQDHMLLLLANLLFGALFLLSCDLLIQLLSDFILIPINALTSLIGAPFVIYILIRKIR